MSLDDLANRKYAAEVSARPKDFQKPMGGILKSWFYLDNQSIQGYLHDDPSKRWLDGMVIYTSKIVKMYKIDGVEHVETLNTVYQLGNKLGE